MPLDNILLPERVMKGLSGMKGNFHVPFLEEGGRVIALLYSAVKTVLKKDFRDGTLKHNHVVSPEYYLELKLKEARRNFFSKRINLRTEPKRGGIKMK